MYKYSGVEAKDERHSALQRGGGGVGSRLAERNEPTAPQSYETRATRALAPRVYAQSGYVRGRPH